MNQEKLSYRELRYVFITESVQFATLKLTKTVQQQICSVLAGYEEDVNDWPTQKDILKRLGLKREELMVHMNDIYQLFLDRVSNGYPIAHTEIHLNLFSYGDGYHFIKLKDLQYLPRVGETIRVPFARAFYGSVSATVTDIDHEFENGKHIISIQAKDQFS